MNRCTFFRSFFAARVAVLSLFLVHGLGFYQPTWAQASSARVYAGARLSEWHERIKNIDPKASGAAVLVEPLLAIIQDESLPGVDREPFAAYLARIGAPARRAATVLGQIIDHRHDSEATDYLWAARALALMGTAASDATPALIDLLFDHRLPVRNRQSAVEALALIGTAHPDAIPAILQLLQIRPSREVPAADANFLRFVAAECVFIAGPECGELAAPLLIRLIRDPRESERIRRSALVALGTLGPQGEHAANVLVEELVNGKSPALRDAAAESLAKIGGVAISAIRQCLGHPDPEVRWRMAFQARLLGAAAAPLQGELHARMEDSDGQVGICAAESVLALYGKSDRVISQAIQLLQSPNRSVRVRAKNLILAMQPIAAQHRSVLERLAADPEKYIAQSARATLDQLPGEGASDEGHE